MLAAIALLFYLLVSVNTVSAAVFDTSIASQIPDTAIQWNGHYYQLYETHATFADAEDSCEALGGHLAVITSAKENARLTTYLQSYNSNISAMIGLYDADGSNGTWDTWVTGEKVTYENWGEKQPDWAGQTICALNANANSYYGWEAGEWDNGWDGDYWYLCEWDGATVTLSKTSYTYSGKAFTPTVKVVYNGETLTKGTDYTVSYSDNKSVGTATVTVTGIGEYSGTAKKTFTIKKASQTIEIEDTEMSVAVGDTAAITASGKGKLTYSSADTSIAKVSSKGVVTGKLPGTVNITVKAAGNSNYKSAKTTVTVKVTAKTTTKPTVKRASYNSLKISWAKFSGASGYYVYRSTKSGSGYKKIATVTSGSTVTYTDTSRATGKTYYYKVKAYKKVDGTKTVIAASKAGSGTATLAKPSVTLVAGSRKITVEIAKKVSGADGYVIYRSTTEDSGYKAVKTVKSGAAFTWKNTGLKAKTTYYYKVRAYRTVSGKKVYSSYSTVVSKKTK